MNQERKEELIVRWMDDETLSTVEKEELNTILEAEPELKLMREGHSRMRSELQTAFGDVEDLPYGDFFQTKLQQAIRNSERDSERGEVTPARSSSSWRDTLRWWLAPVALGAMAVAFLAGTRVGNTPEEGRVVVQQAPVRNLVYTPEGGVTSKLFDPDAEGTSVIVLDGLQPIPDSQNLMAERAKAGQLPDNVQLISAKPSPRVY